MRKQIERQLDSLGSWDEFTGTISTEGLGWTKSGKNLQADKADITCLIVADSVKVIDNEMPGFLPQKKMVAGHNVLDKKSRRMAKGKRGSWLPEWIYKDPSGTKPGAESNPNSQTQTILSYVTVEERGPDGELINKYTVERGKLFGDMERHSEGRYKDFRFYEPEDPPEEDPASIRTAKIDYADMMRKAAPTDPSESNPVLTPYDYIAQQRRGAGFHADQTVILWEKGGKQYRATEELSYAPTIYTRRTGGTHHSEGGLRRRIVSVEVINRDGRPEPQLVFSDRTDAKGTSPSREDRPGQPHANQNPFEKWFNQEMKSNGITDLRLEQKANREEEWNNVILMQRIREIRAKADPTQLQAFQWLGQLTSSQDLLGERTQFGPEMHRLLDRTEISKDHAITLMIAEGTDPAEAAKFRKEMRKDSSVADSLQDVIQVMGKEAFFNMVDEMHVRYINTLQLLKLPVNEKAATDVSWIIRGLAAEYAVAENQYSPVAGNFAVASPIGYTKDAYNARGRIIDTRLGQDLLESIFPVEAVKIPTKDPQNKKGFILVSKREGPKADRSFRLEASVRSRIEKLGGKIAKMEFAAMQTHEDINEEVVTKALTEMGWLAAKSVGMD